MKDLNKTFDFAGRELNVVVYGYNQNERITYVARASFKGFNKVGKARMTVNTCLPVHQSKIDDSLVRVAVAASITNLTGYTKKNSLTFVRSNWN